MAFIFDPTKGETPASLRKKREIAEALRANATGLASSPGEGLAMIGAALGSRIADSKANKIEAYGRQQASSALGPIMEALGGGSSSSPSPAPSAPSAPSAPASPQPAQASGGQGANYIRQGLVQRGLPSHVADAFVANFQDESGLNPGINEAKPLIPGSRGGYGLYQLTGPRRVAYEKFAQERGAPLDSTDAQLDFLMTEMQGPESRAAKNILSSPDTASAAQAIVRDFLRPAPEHRESRMAKYAGLGSSSPAAQAVNAMAQGGQGMPQTVPQMAQPAPGGSAMDVWQGRAQQGMASDGSQIVRTPEGVQRTSGRYGYSEMIRPEGMPSERAPMPRQGQGGDMGAILSSLLGRSGQQQPAQAMPQQAAPQEPVVTDPAAYNAGAVRMSPDLAGGPQRMPTPQNQPPIPGIQPSPLTMADMAGRMPAPQGQPMPQGVEGLRTALQPAPQAPQQLMPAQQAPAAPQAAQAAPRPAQAGANGISLPKLLQIAQDPWVAENKLYSGIVTTLIENQLSMNKPMNPLEKAQLEKLMLDIEQQRNPQMDPAEKARLGLDREKFDFERSKPTAVPGSSRLVGPDGKVLLDAVPDNKAPAVQKLTLSDGSEVAVQWDGEQWVPINAPQGGGVADPKTRLTEGQAKLTLFQSMQGETQPVLLDLESRWNPANMADATARSTPIAGNFFQSEEGQMYQAASTAWAEGALRIATGAAATPEEMERTRNAYFAQPGDTPMTIAFKAQMRNMYDRAIQRSLGSTNVKGSLPKPSEFASTFQNGKAPAGPVEVDGYTIEEGN